MATRAPCETDEWYHVYNRGTDKRDVFMDERDYERFLMLIYTGNATNPVRLFEKNGPTLRGILHDDSLSRGSQLVEIGAYALMPNHMHFVLKQLQDGGIARFTQKIFTGYTMYFNTKYKRSGALFSGTYKAKHIASDEYLKQALAYVMLNPVELFEPRWKEGIGDVIALQEQLLEFPYASTQDFFGSSRPERLLISAAPINELYDERPVLKEVLADALEYYQTHEHESE